MYESKLRVFFRGVLWWTLGLWLFYQISGIGDGNPFFCLLLSFLINLIYVTFARTLFEVVLDVAHRDDPTYKRLRSKGWSPAYHDPNENLKQPRDKGANP